MATLSLTGQRGAEVAPGSSNIYILLGVLETKNLSSSACKLVDYLASTAVLCFEFGQCGVQTARVASAVKILMQPAHQYIALHAYKLDFATIFVTDVLIDPCAFLRPEETFAVLRHCVVP